MPCATARRRSQKLFSMIYSVNFVLKENLKDESFSQMSDNIS